MGASLSRAREAPIGHHQLGLQVPKYLPQGAVLVVRDQLHDAGERLGGRQTKRLVLLRVDHLDVRMITLQRCGRYDGNFAEVQLFFIKIFKFVIYYQVYSNVKSSKKA